MDEKRESMSDNNSDKPIVEQNDEMSERSPEVSPKRFRSYL